MAEVRQPVEAVVLVKPDGKRFIRPFANCGTGPAERSGFFVCRGKLRFAGFEVLFVGPMAEAMALLTSAEEAHQPAIPQALAALN